MEIIDKDQESLNVRRVRKLLKKICTRTDRRNRDLYTTNEKGTKMTMRVTRRKSVLRN